VQVRLATSQKGHFSLTEAPCLPQWLLLSLPLWRWTCRGCLLGSALLLRSHLVQLDRQLKALGSSVCRNPVRMRTPTSGALLPQAAVAAVARLESKADMQICQAETTLRRLKLRKEALHRQYSSAEGRSRLPHLIPRPGPFAPLMTRQSHLVPKVVDPFPARPMTQCTTILKVHLGLCRHQHHRTSLGHRWMQLQRTALQKQSLATLQ